MVASGVFRSWETEEKQGGAHPVGLRLQLAVGQPLVEIDPRQGGADIQ